MADRQSFDAVDLSVMWDRLISITDEGAAALVRSSFSTLVREGFDLSVLIFDARGRMIAQSAKCIPVFIGTAPVTLEHMLRKFSPDALSPSDVVISNDPTIGTGHMFDIAVMRPIFQRDALVGYAISITHLPDIGGMGFSVSATEIYHEGLRLPIVKLVDRGSVDQTIVELIRLNVRTPEQVLGDIFANVSCTAVVARQVREFMLEYGLSDMDALATAILDQSTEAVERALLELPDADYESEAQVEAYDETRTLRCRVEKRGNRITIDFAGTGSCVGAGINVPLPYTKAMALYAVKCLTTPFIPNNQGASSPITVKAPAGSILHALPPSPSAGRHTIGHFIVPLIFNAMASIVPERVCAASGLIDIMTLQGRHEDGREIVTSFFAAGGFGAMNGLDGRQTMPGSSNMGTAPIEIFEPLSGLLIEEKCLRPDSGGAGEFRGGAGQTIVLRNDTGNDLTVFSMANRTLFPAEGLFGGKAGAAREHWIDDVRVSGQGRNIVKPGSKLTLKQPGGGGFGDPARRSTRDIRLDIERGFLTIEGAEAMYDHARPA